VIIVSNLPFGSSVCPTSDLTGPPGHVSALSGRTSVRIRPVIQDPRRRAAFRCLGFPWPFGLPAFASWPSCPAGTIDLPHGRPTERRSARSPIGVSTFHTSETRPGWVPSKPRGRWCPPGRRFSCPTGTCRFTTASPCTPLTPSAWRGPNVTRHRRGFTRVHPSGLPLACGLRADRRPLGFFPELRTPPLPATHVRAGTGPRTLTRATSSTRSTLLPMQPLNPCDLVSHRAAVARTQPQRQRFPGSYSAPSGLSES